MGQAPYDDKLKSSSDKNDDIISYTYWTLYSARPKQTSGFALKFSNCFGLFYLPVNYPWHPTCGTFQIATSAAKLGTYMIAQLLTLQHLERVEWTFQGFLPSHSIIQTHFWRLSFDMKIRREKRKLNNGIPCMSVLDEDCILLLYLQVV